MTLKAHLRPAWNYARNVAIDIRNARTRRSAVSWWNSIYFHHTWKAAGTSYTSLLKRLVRTREVCPEFGTTKGALERIADYRLVAGHFPLSVHELMRQPCAVVTTLRRPLAHLMSAYNMISRWGDNQIFLAHRKGRALSSFDDFLNDDVLRRMMTSAQSFSLGRELSSAELVRRSKLISSIDWDGAASSDSLFLMFGDLRKGRDTDTLLARARDRLFNGLTAYGIVELPEESLNGLSRALGYPASALTLPRLNAAKDQSGDFLTIDDLSSAQLAAINVITEADDRLYTEAREMLVKRCTVL